MSAELIFNRLLIGAAILIATNAAADSIPVNTGDYLGDKSIDQILARRNGLRDQTLQSHFFQSGSSSVAIQQQNISSLWIAEGDLLINGNVGDFFWTNAIESEYLFNPFLLIAPDFAHGLSTRDEPLRWNRAKVNFAAVKSNQVPLTPPLASLEYSLHNKTEVAVFRITDYVEKINPWLERPIGIADIKFSLRTYNARELGFSQLEFDEASSKGVKVSKSIRWPIRLSSALGASPKNCIKSRRCNQIVDVELSNDAIQLTQLPAEAVFHLGDTTAILHFD